MVTPLDLLQDDLCLSQDSEEAEVRALNNSENKEMLLHDTLNDIPNEDFLGIYVQDFSLQEAVFPSVGPVLGDLVARIGQKDRPSCKYIENSRFNVKKEGRVASTIRNYRTKSRPQLLLTARRLMNEHKDRPMNYVEKDEKPASSYNYGFQTASNHLINDLHQKYII